MACIDDVLCFFFLFFLFFCGPQEGIFATLVAANAERRKQINIKSKNLHQGTKQLSRHPLMMLSQSCDNAKRSGKIESKLSCYSVIIEFDQKFELRLFISI